jgi:hypothetical protein
MIPEHLQTIAVVAGMIFLAVLTASLVTSYHTSQQLRRMRIRQLIVGIHGMEGLLQQLVGVSLPRDVRLLFRRDILARYRALKRVHGSYPGIDDQIGKARRQLEGEAPDAGPVLPVPPSQQVYEQWMAKLSEVVEVVRHGQLKVAVPLPERTAMLQQLLERQAECLYGYHMNEVDKFKQEGRIINARSRIQSLQDLIRSLGVHTPRVEELLDESEKAYQFLMYGTTLDEESPATATG